MVWPVWFSHHSQYEGFLPSTPGTKDHCGAPVTSWKTKHPAFSAESRCTIRITCSKLQWSSCSRCMSVHQLQAIHGAAVSSMVTSSTHTVHVLSAFLCFPWSPLRPTREESIFWQTGTSNDQKLTAARLMFPPWCLWKTLQTATDR